MTNENMLENLAEGIYSIVTVPLKIGAALLVGGILVVGLHNKMNPTYIIKEAVIFNSQYTPPTAGDFWNSPEGSKYSFSIDSGKATIRAEKTSDCTLEDLAASTPSGTRIKVYIPSEDKYKSRHVVSADKIIVK